MKVLLPAVLEVMKLRELWLMKFSTNGELLTIPAPLTVNEAASTEIVYAGALAFNRIVPIITGVPVLVTTEVIFDAPKIAVPLGTMAGFQFAA